MSPPRLKSIADLSPGAHGPQYKPENHKAGIVHLGLGAFHRAHQAVMTDDALSQGDSNWRIIAVSLRSRALSDSLNQQNGLFTLIERSAKGASARVIASIKQAIAVDTNAILDAICGSDIKLVTVTVTEKGYGIDRHSRLPDKENPIVSADLRHTDSPSGVLGILVAAIKRRRQEGSLPLTIMSCDNLPENGALLRDGVIGFARLCNDHELANWIEANICFPSSMVDRITPATTSQTLSDALKLTGCIDQAAVEAEPFNQWVIEDNFASGRPSWEAGGALFVSDVKPYERMKLFMVNGTQSMLAYSGFLSKCKYVRDAMSNAEFSALAERHLKSAALLLTELPGIDFKEYATALFNRFSNPAIAHETYQIAMDGTEKMPQRIFQPAIEALDSNMDFRPFAFTTAMWIRFCMCRLDDGMDFELQDPRAAELKSAICNSRSNAAALSEKMHLIPQLIPNRLANDSKWREAVEKVLHIAITESCSAAVRNEVANL